MKRCLLLLGLLSVLYVSRAQVSLPEVHACRTVHPPGIDGILNETAWQEAVPAGSFRQYIPVYDVAPSFTTEVRILFDDHAIYFGARMADPHPDSILRQLGNRDEDNLNADWFAVQFDTYNKLLDAYRFQVNAAGVQSDSRENDDSFDAVWHSAVKTDSLGWTVEIRIPWSAIRFPVAETQAWRIQFTRSVRRYREVNQWALETKGSPNNMVYWGMLRGMEKISPSLRLSLTPYFSLSYENYPSEGTGARNDLYSWSGGADLKWGLDESFTLDLSLMPDFSQVQSDDQVKNLTAFETIYKEQRPFFTEATDLFSKGDLFYSRRIGRIPTGFFSVNDQLAPGEVLKKNPPAAKLLNATKFSGRNRHGLAIGLLNAVTADTWATAADSDGKQRKILTDPASNYNIAVIDQALKNNSSFYLINTSVIRSRHYRDANVSGGGFSLFNKANSLNISAGGAVSNLIDTLEGKPGSFKSTTGYKYEISGGKVKGKWQLEGFYRVMDNRFSANDMGVTLHNNEASLGLNTTLYQFEPNRLLRDGMLRLAWYNNYNWATGKSSNTGLQVNSYCTTLKYLTLWFEGWTELSEGYDYYEPRVPGRFFLKPRYYGTDLGYSSDYRKTLALDGNFGYYGGPRDRTSIFHYRINPLLRVNNHLFLTYSFYNEIIHNDIGFATLAGPDIIFGNRNVSEIENSLSGRYLFNNKLSLNLRLRHYWSAGDYRRFFLLEEDGSLSPSAYDPGNYDFTFNAWNIDLMLWWEFAPGSRLNLIWKNAILAEEQGLVREYWKNLRNTLESPQDNIFTVKFLYYIDYQNFKRKK